MNLAICYIVLNAVKENDSTIRYRCMTCLNWFPIQPSTRQTIDDLKAQRRMYVVACTDCLAVIRPPTDTMIAGGNKHMRQLNGLEAL
jgi:hypothetical protein